MRVEKGKLKRRWKRLAICVLLLISSALSALFLRHSANMLPSEQAADRWSGGAGQFAQMTVFFPAHGGKTVGTADGIVMAIQSALIAQGIKPDEPGGALAYAYSAEAVLNVSSHDRGPVQVFATGVSGNFFLFNPVQLISGAYLPVESVNRDLVIIDETTAWWLFGATDVSGMELLIADIPFRIAGVYRPLRNFASQAADGGMPYLFLYHDALEALLGPTPITALQTVIPSPLRGLGEQVLQGAMESAGIEEDQFSLVVNTDRYTLPALLRVMQNFGVRSMYRAGLSLPPWENAARLTEDFAALSLALTLLFLIYPIILGIQLIYGRITRRKWRLQMLYNKLDEQRELRREMRFEEAKNDPNQFDVDEIIRSVKEREEIKKSEEENETEI